MPLTSPDQAFFGICCIPYSNTTIHAISLLDTKSDKLRNSTNSYAYSIRFGMLIKQHVLQSETRLKPGRFHSELRGVPKNAVAIQAGFLKKNLDE
jgi:hypothetical protein